MDRTETKQLTKKLIGEEAPAGKETIVQIGEGNFMRGFIDWMVDQLHQQRLYDGSVAAIQPTPHGKIVPVLQAQDGLYTVILRGKLDGKVIDEAEVVQSIARGINPYNDWEEVKKLALSPDVKWLFSNTTEAGLVYQQERYEEDKAPLSFPGKVTAFLYERYLAFEGALEAGITLVPCELIEDNGAVLKDIVETIAEDWDLPIEFGQWLRKANVFCNTLVDRIVTGFPHGEEEAWANRLGYEDRLLTVAEPYHLFVIEPERPLEERLPFEQAGLNVKWEPVALHRELKVRLLNGLHTMMFALSFLAGEDTVKGALHSPRLRRFIERGLAQELIPVVNAPEEKKQAYAASVIERFENPFLAHKLTDIGLNAVYKFKTRLLPALEAHEQQDTEPNQLLVSLAALLVYMKPHERDGAFLKGNWQGRTYQIRENDTTLALLETTWGQYDAGEATLTETISALLQADELWGRDLSRYSEKVADCAYGLLNGNPLDVIEG
ncbi:tagaturonate reductase [Shouchella clausii]|uniref:Altronate oxidoreductase n=1 Tax=Shouchella clausii TaxID=79880 RepID=A0A268S5W9_SHOCL|nr:tagaturonate reductase [Shouchella clausii]MEB5480554.1 tagaturonate reductase [Shouchella clausii]PAE98109.1 altronate oxidoreductase [Shouchella clausii]PAF27904.1 altronate oxidoreductase [Shouchella clausii]